MALNEKPAGQSTIKIELPRGLPQISATALDKIPGLRDWMGQMNVFWRDLSIVLLRLQANVPSTAGLATTASVTTVSTNLGNDIAELQSALEAALAVVTATAAAVAAMVESQAELIVDFEDHITAHNHVHGVTGDVVGTTDKQSLDSKTIGKTKPGLVRATGLMGANSVGAGTLLEIPSDSQSVIAGPFDVYGTLDVSGVVVFV